MLFTLPSARMTVAPAAEVSTVGEATAATGISRSAYYKYRDALMPFQNLMAGRIITFQLLLKDRTGVLSGILSILAYCGANILTINQTIPTNGCAMVTMSSETSDLRCSVEELMKRIGNLDGVVKTEVVAG